MGNSPVPNRYTGAKWGADFLSVARMTGRFKGGSAMGFFSIAAVQSFRPRVRAAAEPSAVDGLRTRLVSEIMELNRSAKADFLAAFDETRLATYLEHLLLTQEPRGRGSVWARPDETPAIMARLEG